MSLQCLCRIFDSPAFRHVSIQENGNISDAIRRVLWTDRRGVRMVRHYLTAMSARWSFHALGPEATSNSVEEEQG